MNLVMLQFCLKRWIACENWNTLKSKLWSTSSSTICFLYLIAPHARSAMLCLFSPFFNSLLALISEALQKCKKAKRAKRFCIPFCRKELWGSSDLIGKNQANHLREKFPFWVPNKPKSANLRTQMTCRAGERRRLNKEGLPDARKCKQSLI